MDKKLRVLIVEDMDTDAELTLRNFIRAGYTVDSLRVENPQDMRRALENREWDLIISDHNMPQFDSHEALKILKESGQDIPFIIVSGSIGEEIAVEAMKAGAHDYLMKNNLNRLVPAAEREIQDACTRRERHLAEEALLQSEDKFRRLVEISLDVIWVCDVEGVFTYVSPQLEEMLGFPVSHFIGRKIADLLLPEDRERVVGVLEARETIRQLEIPMCHKNGRRVELEVNALPIRDGKGDFQGYQGVNRDITERKRVENNLKQSLREKETLLQELYHRTKNNMQVISSMLSLETEYSSSPEFQLVLKDMQYRIHSMALVHQKLYQSKDLSSINLREYLGELAQLLVKSYSLSDTRLTLKEDLADVNVLIDTAIPCGLVANELISNALKHAFKGRSQGELCLGLKKDDKGEIVFTVTDDGVGFPEGFDPRKDGKLGTKLLYILGESQLKGKIDYHSENGVSFTLRFLDNLYEKRV